MKINIIIQSIIKYCQTNIHQNIKSYGISACLFGATIFAVNMCNIFKSPYLQRNGVNTNIQYMQVSAVSLIKGCIYTITFPFSILFVGWDAITNGKFERHLIPGSVYCSKNS